MNDRKRMMKSNGRNGGSHSVDEVQALHDIIDRPIADNRAQAEAVKAKPQV
jgi:hypothetical protein